MFALCFLFVIFVGQHIHKFPNTSPVVWMTSVSRALFICHSYTHSKPAELFTVSFVLLLVFSRNLLPICHVCTEEGEKPMVLLPFMAWGNLKLFLRQCKLAEANNPQVRFWPQGCTVQHICCTCDLKTIKPCDKLFFPCSTCAAAMKAVFLYCKGWLTLCPLSVSKGCSMPH